ncbi:MAG: hypothetical protein WCL39_06235 [Armatimonadota bacterium]
MDIYLHMFVKLLPISIVLCLALQVSAEGAKTVLPTASVRWSCEPGPVIKPGQLHGDLDAKRAGAGHVIQVGDTYLMYYWGTGADGYNRILLAQSSVDSPNKWKPLGSVLERQADTDYNFNGPGFPFVLSRDDGPWLMYFCGWGKPKPGGGIPNRTGVATSYDKGRTWKYCEENPIIPLDKPYDENATGSVWVIREKDDYRMYYTSIGKYYAKPEGVKSGHGDTIPNIGVAYATSKDGIHWAKPLDHRVVEPRGFGTDPYEYIASKPCIVKNGDTYTMWVHTFGTAYRLRSLTSTDGIHWLWNPSGPEGELGTGKNGAFDAAQRTYVSVVKHNGEYRCWYTGTAFGRTGMGYATAKIQPASVDKPKATRKPRVQWSAGSAKPVVKPGLNGELDAQLAGCLDVVEAGDKYYAYYWAKGADGQSRICMARSPVDSPNKWEPLGSVLERQPETDYNFAGPSSPCVVAREDGPWMMYVCMWGKPVAGKQFNQRTGLALSYDKGITWRYCDENPVIALEHEYEKESTASICVLYENGLFRMYYTAFGPYCKRPEGVRTGHGDTIPNVSIGYATSKDGIHWTKPFAQPLIGPRRFNANPYEYMTAKPLVIKDGSIYRMWVSTMSTAYRTRSLTSADGITWTWDPSGPDGELGVGHKGAFDDTQRCYAFVLKHNEEYRCWYTGNGYGRTGVGYAVGHLSPPSPVITEGQKR